MGVKGLDKMKQKHKKGLWSPDEDLKLKTYILNHGHACWSSVAINAGLQRNGKSCRLRWINYLRPGLKRGAFSLEEEDTILALHQLLGNKWSQMAHHLPGRTDNEIKNHWHSYLKKRLVSKMVQNNNKCVSEQIQVKSTPQDSSSIYESSLNTDQSAQQSRADCLPKLLFAEWLSLDQFHCHNSQTLPTSANQISDDYSFDYNNNNNNHQDFSANGMQLNEGGGFVHPKSSTISVDDMLQLQFGFEDHISGSTALAHFFPGEFGICDMKKNMQLGGRINSN